jgi:hypothetical protein
MWIMVSQYRKVIVFILFPRQIEFSPRRPLRAPRLGVSILSCHFTDSEPGLSCKERFGAARPHRPTGIEEVGKMPTLIEDTVVTPTIPLKKRLFYSLPQ